MTAVGALDGKAALLVGAGAGIGRAVVDAFVDEGARVAVLEIDAGKCDELNRRGDGVVAVQGDATTWEANQRAVNTVVDRWGRLDALTTFVGVFDYRTPLADLPAERIDAALTEIMRHNVGSCLLSVKAALEPLRAAGGAVVVTLSTSSFYPGRGGALYVASKYAARGLVVELAHELAPDVRVNGVAPGGTLATELRGLAALGQQERRLSADPDRAQHLADRVPLRTALSPQDHAGAYVLLASDRARGTTGTVIHSDGGVGVRS